MQESTYNCPIEENENIQISNIEDLGKLIFLLEEITCPDEVLTTMQIINSGRKLGKTQILHMQLLIDKARDLNMKIVEKDGEVFQIEHKKTTITNTFWQQMKHTEKNYI